MKTGIMGGTFNPIHIGHIQMAKAAHTALGLDRVLFITGGNTPHKNAEDMPAADIRHEMVKSAIADTDFCKACDYEIKKGSFSYTAETLEYLKKEYPEDKFWFILGADSLDYIDKWHEPERIFANAELAVFDREGYDTAEKSAEISGKYGAKITLIKTEICNISSTKIRLLCDMDLDTSEYLPHGVKEIIKEKNLYKGSYTELREKVCGVLEPKRFSHTLGVAKAAAELAEIYGVNIEKAYTAAILHDCAKNIPTEEMYRLCESRRVELDDFEKTHPPLVHAKLGAKLAEEDYGITDGEIISAVKWHTLGKTEMTALEKIIFVADMAEEGRSFSWAEDLRNVSRSDLDAAVLMCVDHTIKYNEARGIDVHADAYKLKRHFTELCGENKEEKTWKE